MLKLPDFRNQTRALKKFVDTKISTYNIRRRKIYHYNTKPSLRYFKTKVDILGYPTVGVNTRTQKILDKWKRGLSTILS